MTTLQVFLLIAAVAAVFLIALYFINRAVEKDEEDLNKWVILFDKKTKQFSEHRINDYQGDEDDVVISISDERLYHKFMDFCKAEKYHICMVNQARKVFEIFIKSRHSDLGDVTTN